MFLESSLRRTKCGGQIVAWSKLGWTKDQGTSQDPVYLYISSWRWFREILTQDPEPSLFHNILMILISGDQALTSRPGPSMSGLLLGFLGVWLQETRRSISSRQNSQESSPKSQDPALSKSPHGLDSQGFSPKIQAPPTCKSPHGLDSQGFAPLSQDPAPLPISSGATAPYTGIMVTTALNLAIYRHTRHISFFYILDTVELIMGGTSQRIVNGRVSRNSGAGGYENLCLK
jgi:hypothetical protein